MFNNTYYLISKGLYYLVFIDFRIKLKFYITDSIIAKEYSYFIYMLNFLYTKALLISNLSTHKRRNRQFSVDLSMPEVRVRDFQQVEGRGHAADRRGRDRQLETVDDRGRKPEDPLPHWPIQTLKNQIMNE